MLENLMGYEMNEFLLSIFIGRSWFSTGVGSTFLINKIKNNNTDARAKDIIDMLKKEAEKVKRDFYLKQRRIS